MTSRAMRSCTSVGEDGFAPSTKPLASLLELVKKKLARTRLGGSFIPSFLHHKLESRHLGPKILKLSRQLQVQATSHNRVVHPI